jgi:hypothetical protein
LEEREQLENGQIWVQERTIYWQHNVVQMLDLVARLVHGCDHCAARHDVIPSVVLQVPIVCYE